MAGELPGLADSAPMRARWLGRVPYREAWAIQRAISPAADDDYLLLMEHPPVYTLGRHADLDHVLVDPASVGADLVRVDRGGDVTYHGPGQLIGYPLVTVGPGPHPGRAHVHRRRAGGHRRTGHLGLSPPASGGWTAIRGCGWASTRIPARVGRARGRSPPSGSGPSRGRTTHGFALNVADRPVDVRPHRALRDRRPAGDVAGRRGVGVTMAEVVEAVLAAAPGRLGRRSRTIQRVTDGAGTATSPVGRPAPPRGIRPDRRAGAGVPRRRPGTGASRSSVGLTRPGWIPTPAWRWPSASRRGSGSRRPWAATTSGCSRTCGSSTWSPCARRRAAPNIYECWADGTATFMINGSRCTRACGFCLVDTRHPLPLDPGEPERVAEAVAADGPGPRRGHLCGP